jgi:SAM-dependent methyltransferase
VWRCPDCRTIHCREVVDLDRYYSAYPFSAAARTWPVKHVYRNLASRVLRTGFRRRDSLLDYGCGSGAFVAYLRARGYRRCLGYDPYAPAEGQGSRTVLRHAPFDFIVLQDVLEHVESPEALFAELDGLLAPGGHVLVGTPNANRIELGRVDDFLNELHVPYHLHVYTRAGVEWLGRRAGWSPAGYHDRPYHELPYLGLNTRAVKAYQRSLDGTLNVVLEPIKIGRALTSPRFHFLSCFGYWLSDRADMTVVFHKPWRA